MQPEGYNEYDRAGSERRLRRFTYRVDGFVSVRAGTAGGEIVTRPLAFKGKQLVINYIAWPFRKGCVRVEVQDAEGHPLDGLALNDCVKLDGNEIEQRVTWKTGATPERYAGQPVRLRFVLKHADLFSLQFKE